MDSNKYIPKRQWIFNKLKDRNVREKRFAAIVQLCNSLHESVDFLQKENSRYHVDNEKLQQLQETDVGSMNSVPQPANVDISSLQKKVYELQQDLMDLHKHKGEHAEQAIELQNSIDEKKKGILYKHTQIRDVQARLADSNIKRAQLDEKSNDANRNLQLVKDEYSALSITYTSLQKAAEKLKVEHADMVNRWKVYKEQVTEDLVKEDELIYKLKKVKIRKELEEAVKESEELKSGFS